MKGGYRLKRITSSVLLLKLRELRIAWSCVGKVPVKLCSLLPLSPALARQIPPYHSSMEGLKGWRWRTSC